MMKKNNDVGYFLNYTMLGRLESENNTNIIIFNARVVTKPKYLCKVFFSI